MRATFIETRGFSAIREEFLPNNSYARLQHELMEAPERGEVAPGCEGLRKLRIPDPSRGKGKRGGARLIYLHVPEAMRFYLIDIYGKDEQDDLSQADKKAFGQMAMSIKAAAIAEYRKRQRKADK